MGLEATGLNAVKTGLPAASRKLKVTVTSSAATGLEKDTLDIPQNSMAQKPAKGIWVKIKRFFGQIQEWIRKWFRPSQGTHLKSSSESSRLSTQNTTKSTLNNIKPPLRMDYKSSFPEEASSNYSKEQIQLDKRIDEGIAGCVKRNDFVGLELKVLPVFSNADSFMRDKQGNILPFINKTAQAKFENFMASLTRLKKQYEKEKKEFLGMEKVKYEELDNSILEEIVRQVESADEETAAKLNAQRLLAYDNVAEIIDAKIEKLNYFQQRFNNEKKQAEMNIQSVLKKRSRRAGH